MKESACFVRNNGAWKIEKRCPACKHEHVGHRAGEDRQTGGWRSIESELTSSEETGFGGGASNWCRLR